MGRLSDGTKPYKVAAVALANKIWALQVKGGICKTPAMIAAD